MYHLEKWLHIGTTGTLAWLPIRVQNAMRKSVLKHREDLVLLSYVNGIEIDNVLSLIKINCFIIMTRTHTESIRGRVCIVLRGSDVDNDFIILCLLVQMTIYCGFAWSTLIEKLVSTFMLMPGLSTYEQCVRSIVSSSRVCYLICYMIQVKQSINIFYDCFAHPYDTLDNKRATTLQCTSSTSHRWVQKSLWTKFDFLKIFLSQKFGA
jgi:hypothetical protein